VADRKPNNKIWIVLGVVCGILMLVPFGYGVYIGVTSVSDEMAVSVPKFPEQSQRPPSENVITIFVDGENEISIDGIPIKDASSLKTKIQSMDSEVLTSTTFILRMSENARHKLLISIKDELDATGANSKLEIMREPAK